MPPPTSMPLWQALQPFSMKRARPSFCTALRAVASPLRYVSNGALGVISVVSKAAIAVSMLS
jgi:hypothetical protein